MNTTADGAGHLTSAALITGRQRRRSIYRDRHAGRKISACLSTRLRLSVTVTRRYYIETAKRVNKLFALSVS